MEAKVLNVNDLININRIPNENEISLSLLLDFYNQYLTKRLFIFTLKNGEVVKLFFKDSSEIFHISGIEHIYSGVPMDGSKFIEGIRNNNLDLIDVKNINPSAYKDYLDRIRSMFCIDTIIKNCEYLFFPGGKIPNTKIKITYLLLKGLDNKNLHLGIDTYKKGRPYFSRTLLVTDGNSLKKFVNKANGCLRVTKLEIRDKDTNELIEVIEREQGEVQVKQTLSQITKNWIASDLQQIIWNFYISDDETVRQIISEWSTFISTNLAMLGNDVLYFMNAHTTMEAQEWQSLFTEAIKESIQNKMILESTITLGCDVYADILEKSVRKTQKSCWKRLLHTEIESHRSSIRQNVNKLDPYWSGKIVGEGIRKYEEKEVLIQLDTALKTFVEINNIRLVFAILESAIKRDADNISMDVIKKFNNCIIN